MIYCMCLCLLAIYACSNISKPTASYFSNKIIHFKEKYMHFTELFSLRIQYFDRNRKIHRNYSLTRGKTLGVQ
jgi:hypothetical protein